MLILTMKNGKEYKVTDENGKYYICGKTQFRKMNEDIASVRNVEEEKKEEKKPEEKPKAKAKQPKEKKGE